jgi:hypothetical protein
MRTYRSEGKGRGSCKHKSLRTRDHVKGQEDARDVREEMAHDDCKGARDMARETAVAILSRCHRVLMKANCTGLVSTASMDIDPRPTGGRCCLASTGYGECMCLVDDERLGGSERYFGQSRRQRVRLALLLCRSLLESRYRQDKPPARHPTRALCPIVTNEQLKAQLQRVPLVRFRVLPVPASVSGWY